MQAPASFVVFSLGAQRYALPVSNVERIVRAVEVTFLPKAPAVVLGVINVEGRVVPVLSLRRRLGLPEKEIAPEDPFIIARTLRREVALAVDEVQSVIERADADIAETPGIVPSSVQIRGVAKLDDGLVLIHDLKKFLSLDEARVLDEALEKEAAHGA